MADRTPRSDGEETRQALLALLGDLQSTGNYPTILELARVSGESEPNVRHHMDRLEAAGVITFRQARREIIRREIVLVEPASQSEAQP